MVTDEHLKYVVETYETGSFRGAARKLYRTPQAIAQGVRRVEKEFGAQLFTTHKAGTGIKPTRHAAPFVEQAVIILDGYDDLKSIL